MVEEKSGHPIWELTNPVPLENDGRSVEELLGKNPDVHYIYACTKVGTWQLNHFKLKVLRMSETVFDKFLIW